MRARSAAASVVRHLGGVAAEATLVAALVATVALALSPVYAPAKFLAGTDRADAGSVRTSGSWVQVDQPLTATGSGTAVLQYGDTFNALYGTKASYPWALAQCWANSTTVVNPVSPPASQPMWGEYRSSFGDGSHIGTFDIIDPNGNWVGGGADCTVTLMYQQGNRWVTLATNTFTVAP